ncbi:3695_t:CDS:2, partial [Funneliformis caledonium]
FTSTTVAENEMVSLADKIKKYDIIKLIDLLQLKQHEMKLKLTKRFI